MPLLRIARRCAGAPSAGRRCVVPPPSPAITTAEARRRDPLAVHPDRDLRARDRARAMRTLVRAPRRTPWPPAVAPLGVAPRSPAASAVRRTVATIASSTSMDQQSEAAAPTPEH